MRFPKPPPVRSLSAPTSITGLERAARLRLTSRQRARVVHLATEHGIDPAELVTTFEEILNTK